MAPFRLATIAFVALAAVTFLLDPGSVTQLFGGGADRDVQATASTGDIGRLFAARRSGVMVAGSGRSVRLLPDDLDSPRHQRFIVELADGHTLLISHNIDIAPRIMDIAVGDRVEFRGQYEWNDQGGLIHWTHHDPDGRRSGGWIVHRGQEYR